MVELFFPNWYDGPATAANWPPGHFYWEDVWGAFPPGPWARVESIISQRGETWKSKALLIYHFKCVLFVSSWKKFSLFLEFYWLLPSICLLHDAAFCRRVGWWSCVMVTVLLKKIRNRQRCLKHFPQSKCQDDRHCCKISGEKLLFCALLLSRRKGKCSLFGATILYYYSTDL